jgi:hypothetical protein
VVAAWKKATLCRCRQSLQSSPSGDKLTAAIMIIALLATLALRAYITRSAGTVAGADET